MLHAMLMAQALHNAASCGETRPSDAGLSPMERMFRNQQTLGDISAGGLESETSKAVEAAIVKALEPIIDSAIKKALTPDLLKSLQTGGSVEKRYNVENIPLYFHK